MALGPATVTVSPLAAGELNMTVHYAVTFEFDQQPPITHRGTVAARQAQTVVSRAVKDAMKAHPGLRWSSLVVVLLERDQAS